MIVTNGLKSYGCVSHLPSFQNKSVNTFSLSSHALGQLFPSQVCCFCHFYYLFSVHSYSLPISTKRKLVPPRSCSSLNSAVLHVERLNPRACVEAWREGLVYRKWAPKKFRHGLGTGKCEHNVRSKESRDEAVQCSFHGTGNSIARARESQAWS